MINVVIGDEMATATKAKVEDTPTKPLMDALNGCFRSIRRRNPEVPNLMLVVASHGRRQVHGLFTPQSWSMGEGKHHEIVIAAESLARGPEATLGTLLHECAHALAAARDIKDTSRQGRFHNGRFKALAEELGISVANDPTIGWSITTLPEETAKLYATELKALADSLKGYRLQSVKVVRPGPQTIKIECECRTVTVPLSFWDKGGLTCNECDEAFTPYYVA